MGALGRAIVVAVLLALCAGEGHAWTKGRRSQTFEIGRVSGLVLDGHLDDWGQAFRAGPFASAEGGVTDPTDLDVTASIGWAANSLWFGVTVRDDNAGPGIRSSLEGDAITIRVSDRSDETRFLIVSVTPPARDVLPSRIEVDPRGSIQPSVDAVVLETQEGYTAEIQIDLSAFGDGAVGLELGTQVQIRDRDRRGSDDVVWFPWADLSVNMAHTLRLAEHASRPVRGFAFGSYPALLSTRVEVVADSSLAGKTIRFADGDEILSTGRLEVRGGRAVATLDAEMPPLGRPYRNPAVIIEGERPIGVTIPDADERRAWQFGWHRLRFMPYAFTGSTFPKAVFEAPLMARDMIGPYTIETEYYDRNYERVTEATEDGRYGAVVSIKAGDRTYRRFRTLYKYSGFIPWWEREVDAMIDLPEEFGIDTAVLDGKRAVVADRLKLMFWSGLSRDQRIGSFLAGLREAVPGEGDEGFYDAIWERDRQWWVGLKRKVYGQTPVEPINAPTGVFKGRAPELVFGSEEEAGFRPGVAAAIDSLCDAWWERSGEPMVVCVARAGKIAHLKAYGHRNERPVTLSTRAPIASMTKLLAGVQMAIAIDQRRVDPDASIATYLPAFEGVSGADGLSVRSLLTHTSGLEGHWGDEEHDFEEQIAGYVPQMEVGRTYKYGGTGYAIAGKVLEAVSGEALPIYLKRHLLEPLGCVDTRVSGTHQDGQSTALDLARIGQLLLNGGAYGDFRFFEYEALQELLPAPLSKHLPGTYRVQGLGTRMFSDEGLSEHTYGHGSSSSTIFRVDPENDLVVTVARWRPGADYEHYKRRLFDTIGSYFPPKTETDTSLKGN